MRSIQLLILSGCLLACEDKAEEGTQAGDCTDGADNDGDGDFDCNDAGCEGAPDCEEADTDTDMDTDTDTDTDTDADTDTDTDSPLETARVRVAHVAPDAPAVDICMNGAGAGIANLSFLGTTGFIEIPTGDYEIEVVPTGADCADAVDVSLNVTLADMDNFTVVAHGYLADPTQSNGFALTPFVADVSPLTQGVFRLQIIHAAAASAFAQGDVWNVTDASNPVPLIENFDYGQQVITELPTGVAFVLGLDIDDDGIIDATFNIPDSLAGFVTVYVVNNVVGVPSLLAHFEDGTSANISAQ